MEPFIPTLLLAPVLGWLAERVYRYSRQSVRLSMLAVGVVLVLGSLLLWTPWSLVGRQTDALWLAGACSTWFLFAWHPFKSKSRSGYVLHGMVRLFAILAVAFGFMLTAGPSIQTEHGTHEIDATYYYRLDSFGGVLGPRSQFRIAILSTPWWCPLLERSVGVIVIPDKASESWEIDVCHPPAPGMDRIEVRLDGEFMTHLPLDPAIPVPEPNRYSSMWVYREQ